MERHARFIVVVGFVLLSVLGLVAFNSWIAAPASEAGATDLRILFRGPVSGLSVGSEVRYLGVPVGRVSDIGISHTHTGHVEVDFATQETLPEEQLVALLEPQGITGLSIIELSTRSPAYPGFDASPGFIPGYPSLLTQLSSSATAITSSAGEALAKLNQLMSAQNIDNLSQTFEQMNRLASNLALASEGMDRLIHNINKVSLELESTLPGYRAVGIQLEKELVPAMLQTTAELRTATASVGAILADNEREIAQLFEHDIPTLVGMTDELAVTLRSVSELVSGLDNEPTRLIYGERVPELVIDLE